MKRTTGWIVLFLAAIFMGAGIGLLVTPELDGLGAASMAASYYMLLKVEVDERFKKLAKVKA